MTGIAFDAIHDALLSRGLKQAASLHPVRYSGLLAVGNTLVPVELEFHDLELQRLPIIRLIGRPDWIPADCNHVDARNIVCYANSSMAFIDRYHGPAQVLYCLDSAARTLNDIRRGNVLGDVDQEFAYYWNGALILVDAERYEAAQPMSVLTLKLPDRNLEILINEQQDARRKYAAYAPALQPLRAAVLIPGTRTPAADAKNWPPKTLQHALQWLCAQAPDLVRSVRAALGELSGLGVRRIVLVFQAEPTWFGIGFPVPAMASQVKYRRTKGYVDAIEKRAAQIEIERYMPLRIDSQHLVERNLRSREMSLLGKRVLLAGCGAIGGYLAHALARAGAGFGSGTLLLVDPDRFKPGNLGRHRLGMEALLLPKAEALRADLQRSLPGIDVRSTVASVLDIQLRDFDFIVDATGEEQLSEALNARFIAHESAPVVFAWIVGNGLAVQSFTLASHELGCLHCWKSHGTLSSFAPADRQAIESRIGRGCDDPFVPFSGASPLLAAGLAMQAILDLCSGQPNPTLRSIEIDYAATHHMKPKSPAKSSSCPACGKR